MGYLRNSKKSAYNHIYNKTTVSADKVLAGNENKNKKEDKTAICVIIIIFIFFLIFIFCILSDDEKNITKETNNVLNQEESIRQEHENYIKEFTSFTESKRYIEVEVERTFKNMMQKCSKKEIYDLLFSEELKEQISYEQFLSYDINSFAIETVKSNSIIENNVGLSFYDWYNKKGYVLNIEDKKITTFEEVK